jgi:hypothetical protein
MNFDVKELGERLSVRDSVRTVASTRHEINLRSMRRGRPELERIKVGGLRMDLLRLFLSVNY